LGVLVVGGKEKAPCGASAVEGVATFVGVQSFAVPTTEAAEERLWDDGCDEDDRNDDE
jgi:hypothetical protein